MIASDVAALEDFAAEVGASGPVAVAGQRTRWSTGGPVAEGTRIVQAPAGIVEFQAEEMTVRVRASTTVAELHEALGARGQRTALPERGGTVGGALAVGENDLHVLGRGRTRDAVLQIRYVSADGRLVTGGGPTVKNVSGFDLPRLLTGSLGTLGLLAEVILRTRPIGAANQWYVADDADPFAALAALYRPSAVLWDGTRTWVHLEGHGVDVEQQAGVLARFGAFGATDGPPPLPPFRSSRRPSQLRALDADATGPFVASIGVGIVHSSRAPVAAAQPSAVLSDLQRAVKASFDPTKRLNPGRVPGR